MPDACFLVRGTRVRVRCHARVCSRVMRVGTRSRAQIVNREAEWIGSAKHCIRDEFLGVNR